MTRVKLHVRYIGRGAHGVPGDVLALEDDAAQRLVVAGRATLLDAATAAEQQDQAAAAKPRARRGSSTSTGKSSRAGKAPAEDSFLNPDQQPYEHDPSNGRSTRPQ
ncbi:hypothetical protein [Streptomyces soliscabiei]|uniref:hypothetical protein n=1 Tax=Streptomyces soliscabiei TaxID=588897 RepID=UPI0029B8369C|nr:hypothetical protein [Streptomyces sp. NY05-11A]MDX2676184.1 hypothetical protein [Streptomyces sp. NY05-11A]